MGNVKKKNVKKKKKKRGFTLIELLAVIIILGVLMIIAIPSVTEYIQTSRKSAYVKTANQYIGGTKNKVNSSEIEVYDTNTTYYIPASCISLEKGGDSPFGEFEEAYVVVTYDGNGYDYYWTSRDTSNMGILLTYDSLLDEESVRSDIKEISTDIGIGEREKILLLNNCNSSDATEVEVAESIENKSVVDPDADSLFKIITKSAVVDNKASTYVSASTGIDFAVAPSDTNGKGVYIRSGTENNRYPIYYYRGAVTDNNVIFANFCWKILRTTETGGIKLIYNGAVSGGKCTSTGTASQLQTSKYNKGYKDNAYVGYMYGAEGVDTYEATHLSTRTSTSSTIKTIVDAWYKTNIDDKGFTSKLEDTVWCNDRSITTYNGATGTGVGTTVTHYSGFTRVGLGAGNDIRPSLECENPNDRFTVSSSIGNGALIYPIALLTADEVTLAGHGWKGYSSSSFLNTGQYWWLMTPDFYVGSGANQFYVGPRLSVFDVSSSGGVRPAISLNNSAKIISGGDGTTNNPYVIK